MFNMRGIAFLLLLAGCLLCSTGQLLPYRSAPRVVGDECPSGDDLATNRDISEALSHIAEQIANGTRDCLEKIYIMAYTGSSSAAGTNHPHNFEVVGAGQRKEIVLPDRPGDYSLHQGDIWKLDIVSDLGFLPGTCLRLCNIEKVSVKEGGNNGWRIDSIMTFGCIDGLGCSPLTEDVDVDKWVDGNTPGLEQITLTKVTRSSCIS